MHKGPTRVIPVAAPAPKPRARRRTTAELAAAGIQSKPRTRKSEPQTLQQAFLVSTDIGERIRADLRSARRESRLINLVIALSLVILVLVCARSPKPISLHGRNSAGAAISLVQTTADSAQTQLQEFPRAGMVKTLPDGRQLELNVTTWSLMQPDPRISRIPVHDRTGLVAKAREHEAGSHEVVADSTSN